MGDGISASMAVHAPFGRRVLGLSMLAFSLTALAALAGSAYEGGPGGLALAPFLVVPLALLPPAIYLLLATESWEVDPAAREVRLLTRIARWTVRDERVPLSDVEAVVVERRVERTGKGRSFESWRVSLRRRSGPESRVSDVGGELEARSCAESLARAVRRPLEDRCSTPATVRQPDELDAPLQSRLRRTGLPRSLSLPPGHPVAESRAEGAVVLSWRPRERASGIVLLALSLLWLGAVASVAGPFLVQLAHSGDRFAAVLALALVPFVEAGLLALSGSLFLLAGTRELEVTPSSATLTTRLIVPVRSRAIALGAVEEVRVAKRLRGWTVELVSDERIISLEGVGGPAEAGALQARLATLLAEGR